MGIDFGERRIGVALSDPTGTLATPAEVVTRRRGKRMPLASLERIARREEVGQLVVGLPLDLSGEETGWCRRVRAAGDELAGRLDLPVAFVDERMTSVVAERSVRRPDVPRSTREQKGRVDAAAAAVILQTWLDRRPAREPGGGRPDGDRDDPGGSVGASSAPARSGRGAGEGDA